MKNLGKKRIFERLTVDAYMGCNCSSSCNCTCYCNCQCSCTWSPLSYALSSVYNVSISSNALNGASSSLATTLKNEMGAAAYNFMRSLD